MIALFLGQDTATSRRLAGAFAARHDPSGQSTSRLDGRSASINEIVAQVSAPGFFGAARVVVVTDLLSRAKRGGRKASDEADADAGAVDVVPVIAATLPGNLLILLDATPSLPSAVTKALPPDASVTVSEPPRGQALVNWIQSRARDEGGEIDAAVARQLAMRLYPQSWSATPTNPRYDRPPDMDVLGNEVSKLVSAAWPGPVTLGTVETMAISGDTDQLFRFADAASAGNLRASLPELVRLIEAGEEPARLSIQLAQQAELGTVIAAAGSRSAATIAKDLALGTPGRVNALQASLRRGGRSPERSLEAALEADRATKRGRLRTPLDALYRGLNDPGDGD